MSTKYKQQPEESAHGLKPSWLVKYKAVLLFAKEHGHLEIPWTAPEYDGLRDWLRQQSHRVRLSVKEKELLNALKEYEKDDSPIDDKRWKEWDDMYRKLMIFYDENGHFVVPKDEDKKLYNWIKNQRQKHRNNTLSEEKIRKLDESGFPLEGGKMLTKKRKHTPKQDAEWNLMYEFLERYYCQFGHCRVPVKYELQPKLPDWIKRQRTQYRLGNMCIERQRKLEKIQFPWCLKGNQRSYKV